jgi:CheY-like chemotaxis protein
MTNTVEWLLSIEAMSGAFYEAAAKVFSGDEDLTRFLRHLAADEKWHHHIIGIAAQYLQEEAGPSAAFSLDPETRARIEYPFREGNNKIAAGSVMKSDVIECIAQTEFSEWNDVFQYVINSLKESRREFEPVAAKMQQHKRYIEKYLETLPHISAHLDRFRNLQPVWHERILITEDFPPIREFLTALLSAKGMVDTAVDGKEGLAKISERYYDVIISDTDMPVMDGIEFYRRAVEIEPRIGGRFLFIAGDPETGHVDFMNQNNLRYLVKPAPIREIASAVEAILLIVSETVVKDH